MATLNPFGLLGDDDAEDPTLLLAAQQQKAAAPAAAPAQVKKDPAKSQPVAKTSANLPSKPLPPAQAVRDSWNEGQRGDRGGGRGGGGRGFNRDLADNENTFGNSNGFSPGYKPSEDGDAGKAPSERRPYGGPRGGGGFRGRGGRGFNRDLAFNENTFGNSNEFSSGYKPSEDGDAGKAPSERRPYGGPRGGGGFRGGRRGGFSNGETAEGERPRRMFDRHSGTGRGGDVKREGAGRGNWGTTTDEIVPETEEPVNEVEKKVDSEKQSGQEDADDGNKESSANEQEGKEPEEKEPEEKEMTLEEYEKVLEEKRKALLAQKSEERKVNLDKELESMQLLSNKKNNNEFFVKLGSDKDKRKEAAEKAKKSVSINEFLKPAKGENYYQAGGRGRGRGRGRGGYGGNSYNVQAPAIEDAGEFPSLGSK